MIRFRRWNEHNARTIADIEGKRKARGGRVEAPISLYRVMVATHLDPQFEVFANRVGGAMAEGLFLRALQYAAEHDGRGGSIRVERERWGALVLSKTWHAAPKSLGCKVYDALLESTICVPLVSPAGAAAVYTEGDTEGDTEVSPAVMHPIATSAATTPPLPPAGGEDGPSDPEPQERSGKLRPRDRERFGRVLEYVIRCGTQADITRALDLRRRVRTEGVPDGEVATLLDRDFAWVTRERLARSG